MIKRSVELKNRQIPILFFLHQGVVPKIIHIIGCALMLFTKSVCNGEYEPFIHPLSEPDKLIKWKSAKLNVLGVKMHLWC